MNWTEVAQGRVNGIYVVLSSQSFIKYKLHTEYNQNDLT